MGVEVKLSPNVFAGQKNCRYLGGGTWKWGTPDSLTTFYDDMGLVDDFILPSAQSHLENFMSFFGASKVPLTITNQEYWDFRNENPGFSFELVKTDVSADAIYKNYTQKGVHYIQVGGGYGFYYLDSDPLGLGVPQFNPSKVQVRSRLKWGGSSSGVNIPQYYKPERAQDPAVAGKRSTVSWNNGLTLSDLSPSPFNLDSDVEFLRAEPLVEMVRHILLSETLTKTDKKEMERIARKQAQKEIEKSIDVSFLGTPGKLRAFVGDMIKKELEKMVKDPKTKSMMGDIVKKILKGFYKEVSFKTNVIDRIKV